MRESAVLHRVKQGYTTGARTLASRSIVGLSRTRVTPNALTTAGVSLCLAASVLVYFEYKNPWVFYWAGAATFLVGSILDILDGALARRSDKATPFGEFLDSLSDRVSEGFVLAAIAFFFGLGMGIGIPLTVILMFSRTVEGRSGQTLGLRLTANNLVRVSGPIVFGAVGSALGLPAVFWIVAAILASGGLLSRSRAGSR